MSKKIISVFLIFAISLSFFALPVHAAEGKSTTVSSTGSFWQMVANSNSGFMQYLMGTLSNSIIGNGTVCPESPDAKHYGTPCGGGRNSSEVVCRCKYCGEQFVVDESVVEDAYNDYVADLDAPEASYRKGYVDCRFGAGSSVPVRIGGSGSGLYVDIFAQAFYGWIANLSLENQHSFFDVICNLSEADVLILGVYSSSSGVWQNSLLGLFPDSYGRLQLGRYENPLGSMNSVLFGVHDRSSLVELDVEPTNFYIDPLKCHDHPEFYTSWAFLIDSDTYIRNESYTTPYSGTKPLYPRFYGLYRSSSAAEFVDDAIFVNSGAPFRDSASGLGGSSATYYYFYLFVPDSSSSVSFSTEYLTHGPSGTTGSSRPGSIAGNWGVMGDDSTVNNIGNQVIVNEDSKTWYNPETGQNEPMESWTYDYATRTYNIVTGDGQIVTVAYGNENLTINKGDVTYNIYYMVDSSQHQASCKHSYTFVTINAPTCKTAGLDQYTCDFCGHMYTANTSATGHTWKILRDVNTSYDENGTLIQEGYTIYECEICGEQYKSTDGSAPPAINNGGSSGSGSGSGDSSGGGIFDKLGALLGTLGGGVVSAVGKFVEFILDSLISLAEMLVDKGGKFIDLILSLFERIPSLFGAFPQFLAAVFPFLPEEFLLILEFGLIAVVVIGILKWLRR